MRIIILLFFALIFNSVLLGQGLCFYNGNGSQGSPFEICDEDDLDYVRNYPNSYFVQINDVTITNPWIPIGDINNPFMGYYRGNYRTISNLNINTPNNNYVGLFGYARSANFDEILFNDATVVGSQFVGILVGYLNKRTDNVPTINDCSVHGTVDGNAYIGGLAGVVENAVVERSISLADVSGNERYIGGLIGYSNTTHIIDCAMESRNVTGSICVGGLVGKCLNSIIETSNVFGNGRTNILGDENVGGLVGSNTDDSQIINSNVFQIPSIMATSSSAGGIAGNNQNAIIRTNCRVYLIYLWSSNNAGGIAGKNEYSIIEDGNSVEYSEIGGECKVGGLVGYNYFSRVTESQVLGLNNLNLTYVIGGYCIGGLVGHNLESDIYDNIIENLYIDGGCDVAEFVGSFESGNYGNNVDNGGTTVVCQCGYSCGPDYNYTDCNICNRKNSRMTNIETSFITDKNMNSESLQVVIFPNPANDQLNIASNLIIESITFFNILGQTISEKEINSKNIELNTASFIRGIYLLEVRTKEAIFKQKILITH